MQRTYQLNPHGEMHIPDAGLTKLTEMGKMRRFSDGQSLYRAGDVPDGFGVVISGQIICGRYGPDGNFTIFGVCGPGDVCGSLGFFANTLRQTDDFADGDVEVSWVDGHKCMEAIRQDSDLAILFLRALASLAVTAVNRIEEQSEPYASVRLAKALINMNAVDDIVNATQQELADYIGVSRVTMSAALSKLRSEGLVETRYKSIKIIDRAQMMEWIHYARETEI